MPTLDPTLYTVAWIAPLEIEVQAALQILDRIHSGRFPISAGDKYVYHAGEICGHNVIIATFAAGQTYGTNSATSLASHVKHYFRNLRFGLLVGVAAGLPDLDYDPPRDIRLGDVLVALPDGDYPAILPYGLGKQIGANKFKLLRDGHSLPQTEPIVGSAIGKIKAIEQEARIILGYYKEVIQKAPKFSDPGQEKDLFNPSSKALPTPRERRPDDKRTRVWYGLIGSGDKLLKCSEGGDDLRKKYHVIGLEMEAAGVLSEIPVGNIRGDDQSLREQVKDQLCRKSDGTFLWVALVVNELGKCQFEEEVLDAMDDIPTDLPKLYDQMVEQITQLQGRRRDVCLTILSMVVIAYRPLHLSEMCHVMNRRKVQDVENAVAMCGSFLTIRDKYIYLIHQSAKDHLDKVHATTSFLKDPSATHYEMYSQSLQVLSAKLHRNIYRLDNPGVTVSEITASRPNPDPLFDLQYSCIYWLNHFLDVDPECVDMLKSAQIISEFFKEHLLHWLESLGLIGEMRHAILALRKLVHQVVCKVVPILNRTYLNLTKSRL
ncbi:hypothetical protein BJX66DRAFT_320651 [Aspergillus keveii]|uniref:Nucleoside phosphorylase domain-containing protein n=1 Tax=Aspergillus keveii TaxID=714993 RepID=A0ABR4FH88_9EURO